MCDSAYPPTQPITDPSIKYWGAYLPSPHAYHPWALADMQRVSKEVKILPIWVAPLSPVSNPSQGWIDGAQALFIAHQYSSTVDMLPAICLDVEPNTIMESDSEYVSEFISVIWAANLATVLYGVPSDLSYYAQLPELEPSSIWAAVPGFTGNLDSIPGLDDASWSTVGQRAVQCQANISQYGTTVDMSVCQEGWPG